jgi:hypothetical protein
MNKEKQDRLIQLFIDGVISEKQYEELLKELQLEEK